MASSSSKKRKSTTQDKNKSTLSKLKTLGHELLSSRAHINNLPLLLNIISPSSPPHHVLESLLSLQSFFSPLLPQLPSSVTKTNSTDKMDPEFIYKTWVRSKFDEFVNVLINVCASTESDDNIREVVLDTIMEFVKLGNGGRFNSSLYHKFIDNIVHSELPVDVLLESLASKYFKYIDVRYFTYISLEKLIRTLEADENSDKKNVSAHDDDENRSRSSIELSVLKIHYILLHIPPLEGLDEKSDNDMWSASGLSSEEGKSKVLSKAEDKHHNTEKKNNVLSAAKIVKKMKLKFTKAWISFLRLPLPLDVYKEVLVTLHQSVIPYLSNPIMLCDFLTRSYDIGGVISVMSLSSLFILMTQHGLEYPNFYEKLYALLVPSIFLAKHRSKFFELLDSCLKSPLLPAYLASAFAKKLSRLALSVPPSGALVIIALIHNLLRRHPSINCLVHREDVDGDAKDKSKAEESSDAAEDSRTVTPNSRKLSGIDHFNNKEADPVKTNAMRSSLWEIDTLRHHYCPPVSRFVLSLENDLTVRAKTTEITVKDFSSGSYATIFGEEMRRRVKQVPLAFYKTPPTSLFSESDFAGWTFSCDNIGENSTEHDEERIVNGFEEQEKDSTKRQRIEVS